MRAGKEGGGLKGPPLVRKSFFDRSVCFFSSSEDLSLIQILSNLYTFGLASNSTCKYILRKNEDLLHLSRCYISMLQLYIYIFRSRFRSVPRVFFKTRSDFIGTLARVPLTFRVIWNGRRGREVSSCHDTYARVERKIGGNTIQPALISLVNTRYFNYIQPRPSLRLEGNKPKFPTFQSRSN